MNILQADIELGIEEDQNYAMRILAVEKELVLHFFLRVVVQMLRKVLECALGPPAATAQPFDIDVFLHAEMQPSDYPEKSSFQCLLKSTPLLELPQVRERGVPS